MHLDMDTTTLLAFAIETFGRLGEQAQHLISELAHHCASRGCGPFGTGAGAAAAAVRGRTVAHIRKQVSVALQMSLSNREMHYAGAQRRRHDLQEAELVWDEAGRGVGVYRDM